ncbi:hypothetical protein Poli38472_009509 [Pythium oligandrum]|uniref:Exportin-5 n=1 Tax=Pythium oligandrum TaxID=41045 RepID=A0A8K1CEL9_PYTOL|nr:hypothetical protein Poli38472_009509 [Pythium oligandrum]|eukprot:TMW62016.1 hypothetical protein Poli38472_009509 [Pythium oligandrum]
MDPQLYHQVLLAIQVNHSHVAGQSERTAAYAFIEEFKNRDDCALYAVAIFKAPTASAVDVNGVPTANDATLSPIEVHTRQHFALHVLEHYVLTHWSRLPVADQLHLRSELMVMLLQTVPSSEDPVFIKEKKVALIAQIAKRQFPQRWPDFLTDILQVWQVGTPSQIELLLMILRSLAEDCVSSSFNSTIPPARRKDILQGLNACLPQLFPVIYSELEKQYAAYQSDVASRTSSKRLIGAALEMLKEFLDWMPLDKPVEPSTNLIMVAILLLGDEEFRVAAAECLDVYVSRSFGKENRRIMVQTITQIIEKVSTLDLQTLEPDLEANLVFHKKVNDILVTWGTTQLDVFLQDVGPQEMGLLMSVLQNLCRLFAHPSLIVAETQIVFWLNALKNKAVLQHPDIAAVVARLREISFEKYFKLGSPDRDEDTPAVECSRVEYDDHHEYMAFFGNFRGRLYALIRVLVQLDANTILKMLHERLPFVLTQHSAGSDHLSPRGLCSELSTAFLYHEGITSLIDCVVKQLPNEAIENPENRQILQAILNQILSYSSQDPLLKYRQLFVLAAFPKYYVLDGAILTSVFETLFVSIDFALPGEDVHGHMSNETMNVRRRALASLVAICQAIPAHILPVLPVLVSKVQELFAGDRVLDSEGVLLYEMLVLVSNSMQNADERAQFLQQIAQDPISLWTSAEMTNLVGSAENVVGAIETAESNPEVRKMLAKIVKTLTTIYAIAKRATVSNGIEPFAPSWPQILPNVVALIRTLHSLQQPVLKDAIMKTSTACWLLSVSVDEIAQLLGGKHQLEEEEVAKLPAASKWSKWHKNIRDVSYHIMGTAAYQPSVYASGQMAAYLQSGILSDLDAMDHRHMKNALASVFLPFLKSCPKELYPSLLEPVLSTLLTHLGQRFATSFVKPEAGQKSPKTPWTALVVGVEDAKRDVAQEKMLMDLTRQVMEFLESAIDAKTVVGADTDTPKHVTQPEDEYLRDYILLQSPTLPFLVGAILVQIVSWKDTMSCRKATILADKLVNMLHMGTQFHVMLGRDIFLASLQALLQEDAGHVKEDGLKWELINLVRNIYCRLTLGLVPVEECKGIDPCNQPQRPVSMLCSAPREILLSLPDVTALSIDGLEGYLREKHSVKSQKNSFKEFLEVPMLALKREQALASASSSPVAASLLLSGRRSSKQIEDLPERLVIPMKEQEAAWKLHETQNTSLDAQSLFSS